jgi:hypothetical protein
LYDHQGQLLSRAALELRLRPLQSTAADVTLLGKATQVKGQQENLQMKKGNRPSLF